MTSSTSQPQSALSAASASTTSITPSAQDSPLLNLSAELRNQIYTLVLVEDTAIHAHGGSLGRPGLLRTCKQIEAEASQVFFAYNTFVSHLTSTTFKNFVCALKKCPATACMSKLAIALDVEKEVAGCEIHKPGNSVDYPEDELYEIKGDTGLLRK